jgi:preprotein translocase subunit Sss1
MSRDQLDNLFKDYETAFDKLDLKTISGYCADSFISAGPKGSMAQSKKEYEKKAEQVVQFYRSVGRKSARIISKRVMPICNEYSMVVVRWGVTFEKIGTKQVEFDVSYIIQETDIDPKIILLISHEDEEAAIKKLGLQPIRKI